MESLRARHNSWQRIVGWIVILAVSLGFITWDTLARAKRSLSLSGSYGVAVDAPLLDAASPTGYELGRRSIVLPLSAPDALHWIMQAQDMRAREGWRVRTVDYDNAPHGREVHWSSPFRWWLVALGQIDHAATGTPMPIAIERAVLWANPVLFCLLLAVLIPAVVRRFGAFAAALLAAGMLGALPFAVQFAPGNADHHGMVGACAIGMVLFLVFGGAGAVGATDAGTAPPAAIRRRARAWFAGSGLLGGLGLWISAAGMVPVLAGTGIGAVMASWILRRDRTGIDGNLDPTLWRWWGAAGGATSLLAYLIEYAPGPFATRLEINHPLYALAWVGAGELLFRVARVCRDGRPVWSGRELAGWAGAATALLAAPLAIVVVGSRVFLPLDPFLQRLHSGHIMEFQSQVRFMAGQQFDLAMMGPWLPAVGLLASFVWLRRREVAPAAKAGLALACGPALVMLGLAGVQIRWGGLACGMTFVAIICTSALFDRLATPAVRCAWRIAASVLFVPGAFAAVLGTWRADQPTVGDIRRLVERDVAHRLRLRAGCGPLVVASTPDATTSLIYFGSARGLGTMYWENGAGLKKAAALFAAPSAEAAREIAVRTGITHFVFVPWEPFEDSYVRLDRGLPPAAPPPAGAFVMALRSGRVPSWLRPIPHRLPDHPVLRGQAVRVYEVVTGRSPGKIAADTAAFLVEMGRAAEAGAVEPALAAQPRDLCAVATLAAMQARRGDAAAFAQSLEDATDLLSEAGRLALEDRTRVAMVLAIGGRAGLAARELRLALEQANEMALRRLTPGEVADLLELTDALGVGFPDTAMRDLAERLAPPGRRSAGEGPRRGGNTPR